jgi:hypothetical protein
MLLQLHRCTPREELEEFSTKEVLLPTINACKTSTNNHKQASSKIIN